VNAVLADARPAGRRPNEERRRKKSLQFTSTSFPRGSGHSGSPWLRCSCQQQLPGSMPGDWDMFEEDSSDESSQSVVALHNNSPRTGGYVPMLLVTFGSKSNGEKDSERHKGWCWAESEVISERLNRMYGS